MATHLETRLIELTHALLKESKQPYPRDFKSNDALQKLNIDSLLRSELFRRIENDFDIKLPDSLLAQTETLDDIAHYLETHHSKKLNSSSSRIKILPSWQALDRREINTLVDIILLYGEKNKERPHLYFQHENEQEEIINYGQLLTRSLQVASGLKALGLKENETVALMLPTTPLFFYAFLGILLAGGIPVPIYPPFRVHLLETYTKTEARILRNAEVRILITFDRAEKLSQLLKAFVPSLNTVVTAETLTHYQALSNPKLPTEADHALIQYTSGSTSDPKGVLLTHFNLISNIKNFGETVKITEEDVIVSWLPLYHDFGLIGAWLGSLYHGVPLVLMTPFSFLNHPERWLWMIHYYRGTMTGAPNFAYDLCIRKIPDHRLEGLDLSSWRIAANGAEKVYPRTLHQFSERFAPYGFKKETLLPVYGLAESTVGLAIPPLHRPYRIDTVDRKTFEEKKIALPVFSQLDTLEFVSCGLAMPGHEIAIIDNEGNFLSERQVGEVVFRGPSSMKGYFNHRAATEAIYFNGWLKSGDLAYMVDGEVFITGRKKDLIIKAGKNIYPVEIEELVGHIEGIRQGCVAAFSINDAHYGTEKLIVVAETNATNDNMRLRIKQTIFSTMANTLDIVPDEVILAPPKTVPKTSSGKLQRSRCKELYLTHQLKHHHAPPWLQTTKLIAKWLGKKSLYYFGLLARLSFTTYVALIFLSTFIPLTLALIFLSSSSSARLLKVWAKILLGMSFCPISITSYLKNPLTRPLIYAANHASYIDALVAIAITPPGTRLVGKKELRYNPIFHFFIIKLRVLLIDRFDGTQSKDDVLDIQAALKQNEAIFIFPEGTFGYAQGLRPFKLGTFKVAAENNIPICPIAIKGTRSILRDTEKLLRPGKIEVRLCDIIYPTGHEWQDIIQLRQAVRAQIVQYCGEPSLDFIVANTIAPSLR